MGLLQVENFLLHKSCHRTFSFIHRTVQEFAAACCLITQLPDEQIRDMIENKRCNHKVIMVFYAELTSLKGNISTSIKTT